MTNIPNPQANTNPAKSCSLDELKQELLDEIDSLHYMCEQEKTKDIDKYFAKILALITEKVVKLANLYGEPRCEDLHHDKKNQHGYTEYCPVEKEIFELLKENK